MKRIKVQQSSIKILVFSSHDEKQYGVRYVKNGADGYLNKFCSEVVLVNAIKEIVLNGSFYSNLVKEKIHIKTRKIATSNPIENLSNREFEIAQLLIAGNGNLEISNKLDIKMSTVSTYKNRIFEKLNVNNVVSLSELFKIQS